MAGTTEGTRTAGKSNFEFSTTISRQIHAVAREDDIVFSRTQVVDFRQYLSLRANSSDAVVLELLLRATANQTA